MLEEQNLILDLLELMFKNDIGFRSYFYTNDFPVLVDVFIRELYNMELFNPLRQRFITVLPLILKNSDYFNEKYKFNSLMQCLDSNVASMTRELGAVDENTTSMLCQLINLTQEAQEVFK